MVAIDMEMPKECYMCPLLDDEYGVCKIIGETKVDMTEERAKDCPLVEIVTCENCKHSYSCKNPKGSFRVCHLDCCKRVKDDYFCPYGERRE